MRMCLWVPAAATLSLALLTFISAAPPPAEPKVRAAKSIRVGLLMEMSGPLATFGHSARNGVQLAIGELNQRSATTGARYDMTLLDVGESTKAAEEEARKLVQQGPVQFVLGPVSSGKAMAAAPVLAAAGIPMVVPCATHPDVTDKHKMVFRACYLDKQQGEAMALHAYRDLKLRSVAIMHNTDDTYSAALSGSFGDVFEKLGGKVVHRENVEYGDDDFAAAVTGVQKAKPDGLFLPLYYIDVSGIALECQRQGLGVPLLGCDGWESTDLVPPSKGALEGAHFATHYVPDTNDRSTAFSRAYQAKFNMPPDSIAALAYDAMHMVATALSEAETSDAAGITKALAALEGFNGVTGDGVRFDTARNAMKPVLIAQIKDGKFLHHKTINSDEVAKALTPPDAAPPEAE